MPSSRMSRTLDPPASSPEVSADPFLEFPKESDLYPDSSERGSSKEELSRVRLSSTERLPLVATGIAVLAGVLIGVRYVPEAASPANLGAPLDIETGKSTAKPVDFAAAPLTGALEISSDPPGARVSVDGTPRGQTPLKIPELTPGEHRVRISSGRSSVERAVIVTAGAWATVVVVWKPEPASSQPNLPQLAASFVRPADVPNRAIYTALDPGVTPPVELERDIPPWSPPEQLASRWFHGVVQVVVDEHGSVESAQLVRSLADFYDSGLLGAARSWRFKPALRADQPVRYRKIVEITMSPRPSP